MAVIAIVDHIEFSSNKKKTVCTFRRRTPAQHAAFLAKLKLFDWISVISCKDADQAFHNFYEIIVSLLDMFYPLKSITVCDKDPYFITPEIKFLLRTKNKLMRSGKLQAADSLSRRIGERIARCNASYFSSKKPTSRELWGKVRKVMGKELRGDVAGNSNFTATMLNDHYARISTDPHYDCLHPKLTASNNAEASFEGGWGAVAPSPQGKRKKERKRRKKNKKREKKKKKERKKGGNYE